MSDRTTDLYGEDTFGRADNASQVGGGWTVTGSLQISQEACLGDDTARVNAIRQAVPDRFGPDYEVWATLACDDDTQGDPPEGDILVRMTPSSEGTSNQGYAVGLKFDNGAATLQIKKIDGGTETVLTSATVTTELDTVSSSYLSVFQTIRAIVQSEDEYVRIDAYLNDEERARLTWNDRSYPLWRRKGEFGFQFDNGEATNHLILDSIAWRAINPTDNTEKVAGYWSAGRIVDQIQTKATRDSGNRVNREGFLGDVNEAMAEMAAEIKRAWFWEDLLTFVWKSGQTEYELPPDTSFVDNVIWDNTSQTPYRLYSEEEFRESVGNESSGTPNIFRRSGIGPRGGPLIRAYNSPDSDRSYTIRRFRSPRVLVNDDDIPDLPQRFAPALVWGGLLLYAARDTNRTLIRYAGDRWERWLKRIKHNVEVEKQVANTRVLASGMRKPGIVNDLMLNKYGIRR